MHTHQETFDLSNTRMIAQGRPGWDGNRGRCSYSAGCAAAQFMTPEQRKTCDNAQDQDAFAEPAAGILREAGHDPEFVMMLQQIHDRSARDALMNGAEWRSNWMTRLHQFAHRRGLSMDATLTAARAAGWAVDL